MNKNAFGGRNAQQLLEAEDLVKLALPGRESSPVGGYRGAWSLGAAETRACGYGLDPIDVINYMRAHDTRLFSIIPSSCRSGLE